MAEPTVKSEFDAAERDAIYRAVKARVDSRRAIAVGHGGLCLYWAYYTIEELKARGLRAVLQAGDCFWPRLPREAWGGEDPDEGFGFQWDPTSSNSIRSMAAGNLPEVHVWCGVPATQTLIDLSTSDFEEACLRILGKDWPGPKPPPYFWGHVNDDRPEGVVYEAKFEPTAVAHSYLLLLRREGRL